MKQIKSIIVFVSLQIFALHNLAGMYGGGKSSATAALLSSTDAGLASYGATDHSAHGTTDGKGPKSTAGSSGAHTGGEKKELEALNPANFFEYIRTGSIDDVQRLLALDQRYSICTHASTGAATKSAVLYAFHLALCANSETDCDNYLKIFKIIFDVVKHYDSSKTKTEESLVYAPVWCWGGAGQTGGFLHQAVDCDHAKVAKFVVAKEIVHIDDVNAAGHTALAFARSSSMATTLIDLDINVNHRTPDGISATDMVTDEIKHLICAAENYKPRACACCGPCIVERESCGCSVMCDLLWWLRC